MTLSQAKPPERDLNQERALHDLQDAVHGQPRLAPSSDRSSIELTDLRRCRDIDGDLSLDLSRVVYLTSDFHTIDPRIQNAGLKFASWIDADGKTHHKQLAGPTGADAAFALEDLQRAVAGGELRYRAPVVANDNIPAKSYDHDSDRDKLAAFQAEQLIPGCRGSLVFDSEIWRAGVSGNCWRIAGATVDGQAGDVFIAPLDGQPKFQSSAGRLAHLKFDVPFPLVSPADWHGVPVPSREWFIDGLVPHRQVTILSGDGGVGKSLAALQIGAAAALGSGTMGLVPTPGRVLYLGAEDDQEEFQRRLHDICRTVNRSLADLADMRVLPLANTDALLSAPDPKGNMQPSPLWTRLERFVVQWQPRLVVLDTAADLFGGDEIKRTQVRQFVAMLRRLAITHDCAVLLLAHPSVAGMQSGSGYSGSTAWNNSVRSRLYLTADGDTRILKTMKSNYGKIGDELRFEWRDGAFHAIEPGAVSSSRAMVEQRADKVFVDVLRKTWQQGQRCGPTKGPAYAPRMIHRHADAKGLRLRDLEEAMLRLLD